MAQTYTSTQTYTRILFLQKQIREALRSTTQISDDTLNTLLQAIEKKWIRQIDIYAFNFNNLCQAQLIMEIDWNEHDNQIAIGKITIAVDTRWKNDLLPQVDASIWAFNAYVDKYNLRTDWRIMYSDHVVNDTSKLTEVRRFLGTAPAEPIKWSDKPIGDYVKNDHFSELGIRVNFAQRP
jgi:hypothetical protein